MPPEHTAVGGGSVADMRRACDGFLFSSHWTSLWSRTGSRVSHSIATCRHSRRRKRLKKQVMLTQRGRARPCVTYYRPVGMARQPPRSKRRARGGPALQLRTAAAPSASRNEPCVSVVHSLVALRSSPAFVIATASPESVDCAGPTR